MPKLFCETPMIVNEEPKNPLGYFEAVVDAYIAADILRTQVSRVAEVLANQANRPPPFPQCRQDVLKKLKAENIAVLRQGLEALEAKIDRAATML